MGKSTALKIYCYNKKSTDRIPFECCLLRDSERKVGGERETSAGYLQHMF